MQSRRGQSKGVLMDKAHEPLKQVPARRLALRKLLYKPMKRSACHKLRSRGKKAGRQQGLHHNHKACLKIDRNSAYMGNKGTLL